jgi:hypothetical protein
MKALALFISLLLFGQTNGYANSFARVDSPDNAYHYEFMTVYIGLEELEDFVAKKVVGECKGRPCQYVYLPQPTREEMVHIIPARPIGGVLFRLDNGGEVTCRLKGYSGGVRNTTFENCLIEKTQEEDAKIGQPVQGMEIAVYIFASAGISLFWFYYTRLHNLLSPYGMPTWQSLFR